MRQTRALTSSRIGILGADRGLEALEDKFKVLNDVKATVGDQSAMRKVRIKNDAYFAEGRINDAIQGAQARFMEIEEGIGKEEV